MFRYSHIAAFHEKVVCVVRATLVLQHPCGLLMASQFLKVGTKP